MINSNNDTNRSNTSQHSLRRTLQCIVLSSALTLVLSFMVIAVIAQKKNSNTKPYPYGNPVIQHMYTADASPHVMPDGKMWMVTSVDSEEGGGYPTMHKYHTFSSADLKTWKDHGEVFNIDDVMPKDVVKQDWALWAPDMIYRNGKYYLYYPIWIHHVDSVRPNGKEGRVITSYIGVAVSDAPDKRFTVLKSRIEGTSGIDPAVFADDDGSIYLLWGHRKMAKLKDNMTDLETKPIELNLDTERFMEAIWMHKKNGKYYVSFHTKYGNKIDKENPDDHKREKSEIAYSYSDNIYGPYKYGGVVNYELGVNVNEEPKLPGKNYVPWRLTQSNHVGIAEFHGQDYLFYHTSALSSWRQDEFKNMGTWTQRSVCVDKLNYNADGTIIPVQQTIEGVEKVTIKQPYKIELLKSPTKLNSNKTLNFSNIQLGTGYYYFSVDVSNVTTPFLLQIKTEQGALLATVPVKQSGIIEVGVNYAKGLHNIVINPVGNTKTANLKSASFFAGSPSK
jgi:arabinoxylan arabinofuranohydrolase